ncbi:MAG TPA: phosphoribosylglycinamide formyltransferase [Steroidobacteraceae bacterium]|nr:phosphoribosylglycinamide formyltransferase [Steroidobacteraceae bacterium]
MPSGHHGMMEKIPVVILISGLGSNMCALADRAKEGALPIEIRAVISDRAHAPGLERARERGIHTGTLSAQDFPTRDAFDAKLAELVDGYAPKLVVLAGYMKILSTTFVRRFKGRLLNIHPSLLPKYPGLHTHRRALEAGDKEHGASVHFVTDELDSGPIVIQGRMPVRADDTERSLAARVHEVEHKIYPQAVEWFARGRVTMSEDKAWLDGQPLDAPVCLSFE